MRHMRDVPMAWPHATWHPVLYICQSSFARAPPELDPAIELYPLEKLDIHEAAGLVRHAIGRRLIHP